jgi:multidrug resistance protein MdtO
VSAIGKALPATSQPNSVDQTSLWFWNVLKKELSPYPGRAWVVARVTIASTIVMLLVMTFQLPGGFLGAIFTFFLSRENPTATFRAGLRTVIAFLIAAAYVAITATMFLGDPFTHFMWVGFSLLLAFYLIRTLADYGTAAAFGFLIAGAIPLWDQTILSVNARMENTLWTVFSVVVGVTVTVIVEYVFRRVHPTSDLTEGIEVRLQTVETVLRSAAAGAPLDREMEKKLELFTTVGTSRLRRLVLRSSYGAHFKSQMNSAISLVGRLIDITATFHLAAAAAENPADRERCVRLADHIATLRKDLFLKQLPENIQYPAQLEPSTLHFLPEMERTVGFIPQVFAGSESVGEFVPSPLDEEHKERLFVADAFTNTAHLRFALRGTIAALASYVLYTAMDWPGLSTSLATCFITALSTIGSSRQKQILRLGGALIGGILFGMGSQVFVLPHLDSIAGFTLLFAAVTGVAAWISTASARLSYLGVQLALAFYLINLQEFTVQTSLAIARDRVFGVLLGLACMWLLFDRLWVRDALDEMQTVFARNLELLAELTEQFLEKDPIKAVRKMRSLRDQINDGFQAVMAQSDAILFEFGPQRQRKLQIREDIRRWQPSVRTLLQLLATTSQYRVAKVLGGLPPVLRAANLAFEKDVVSAMRAMSYEISGKGIQPAPDILLSAAQLRQEIDRYYRDLGCPVAPDAADVLELTSNLASVLSPLHQDVHSSAVLAQG